MKKPPPPSPCRRPEFALLHQLLALLQLILPEVAAHHRAAMLIEAIDEALVGHADATAFPTLDVSLIDSAPPLPFPQSNPVPYALAAVVCQRKGR